MLPNVFRRLALLKGKSMPVNVQHNILRSFSSQKPNRNSAFDFDVEESIKVDKDHNEEMERQEYMLKNTGRIHLTEPVPPTPYPSELGSHNKARSSALFISALVIGVISYIYYVNERRDPDLPDPMARVESIPEKYSHLKEHEARARMRADKGRERRRKNEELALANEVRDQEQNLAVLEAEKLLEDTQTEEVIDTQNESTKSPVTVTSEELKLMNDLIIDTIGGLKKPSESTEIPIVNNAVKTTPDSESVNTNDEAQSDSVVSVETPIETPVENPVETPVESPAVASQTSFTPQVETTTTLLPENNVNLYIQKQKKIYEDSNETVAQIKKQISSNAYSITDKISKYSAERQAYLNKLRKSLETGAGGADRLVQLLERKDDEFFNDCNLLLTDYTKESIKSIDASNSALQAQQAAAFAEELRIEAAAVRNAVREEFQQQFNVEMSQYHEQMTAKFDAQVYRLALEHSKAMDELTESYSNVLDNLSSKLKEVAATMEKHHHRRLQSDNLQRLTNALYHIEQKAVIGEPLVTSWPELEQLADFDPIIKNVISSVPQHIITNGVPPITHLQRRFESIEQTANSASFIPPQPNFTSHLLASVFGRFLVSEKNLIPVPEFNETEYGSSKDSFFKGIEYDQARMSRAAFFLNRGDIKKVVRELEAIQNPNLKSVTQTFLVEARDKLVVDQALSVIRAHSTAVYKDMFD